jgi:hypothetical protein
MTDYTYGWIDAKITETDALIFKDDAEILMNTLAEGLAKTHNRPVVEMYEARAKVRRSSYLAATVARHSDLFPGPVPEHDEIIRSAFHDSKTDEETALKLAGLYGYMFANQPVEPPQPPPPSKGSLRRLLDR